MGAWGVLAFDNDDANDWAYDLEGANDLSLVESAFAAVEESDDYLEAFEACNALAACEVLARLTGKPGYQNSYSEKVDQWVLSHAIIPTPSLLNRASTVIDRILADDSELRELWQEGDEIDQWLAAVQDLRSRLKS